MGEIKKKVGCTLPQDTYSKLSAYAAAHGTTVTFMHHILILDAIANNRWDEYMLDEINKRKSERALNESHNSTSGVYEELVSDFEKSKALPTDDLSLVESKIQEAGMDEEEPIKKDEVGIYGDDADISFLLEDGQS